jgi:OLD-like protein
MQAPSSTPKPPRAVVLVEGTSDAVAVEVLAERRERDLEAEGVVVVPIGGAQAIGRFLGAYPRVVRLVGLCDAAEEPEFRRALEAAGFGASLDREGLERLGFFTCEPDLEGELMRALGADAVLEVAEAHGEIGSFRTLQRQPEWRERPLDEQLRRWLGSGGSRKIRYARYLVEALDLAAVPRPLDGVLAAV